MDAYLWGIGAVLVAIVMRGLWVHAHPNGLWGQKRIVTGALGAGAYRSAPVHSVRARHAPRRVLLAGILSRVWAALTLLVFAPAGVLGAMLFGAVGEHSPLGVVFVVLTAGVVISGFALGVALARAGGVVMHRERLEPLAPTLRWSYAHHVLVAATFLAGALAFEAEMARAVVYTVVPVCAVGIAITWLLGSAERRSATIDERDDRTG